MKYAGAADAHAGRARRSNFGVRRAPWNWLVRLSLARRFMLASLVILVSGMLGIGIWVSRRIESGVINRSSATTALFVDSFVAPHLQELSERDTISRESAGKLDWELFNTALGDEIAAFRVWNHNGVEVYSMQPELAGLQAPIEGDFQAAWDGEVTAKTTTLNALESRLGQRSGSRLLRIYTPIRRRGTDQVIAVVEFYQPTEDLEDQLTSASRRSWLIVGGITVLMYLLLAGFVQRASETIARQQRALGFQVNRLRDVLEQNELLHERVSRAAARTTALNERFLRRFSAELHDGPAQDLSLALLKLDNVAVACADVAGSGGCVNDLETIQQTVLRALQEVRSTSAGLLLPQLNSLSLTATVRHVVRSHERRTRTAVTLNLAPLPSDVPLAIKIAVYRVIQEALNNAALHAGGAGQRVDVSADDETLAMIVSDTGPGFDAHQSLVSDEHMGLAGMRERVESLGGRLLIESVPGAGTKVIVQLRVDGDVSSRLDMYDARHR